MLKWVLRRRGAAASPDAPPVDVLVVGRDERAAGDEALAGFAATLGPRARLAFHLTLEDPPLRVAGPRAAELLQRLDLSDDEPIVHAFVTRAIANAQAEEEG